MFGVQSHENGRLTKKCDAALAAPFLCVKAGTDADHVAVTAADTDVPQGLAQAATDAAEDIVAVDLFGKGGDTKVAVAAAAIAHLARVVPAAAGKLKTLPASAGTYYVVGRALTAPTADGDHFELDDCTPYPVVVSG